MREPSTLLLVGSEPAHCEKGEAQHEHVDAVWIRPALPEIEAISPSVPGLLTFPQEWCRGDPAAVVIAEQIGAGLWRDQLVEQLLTAGAAVLELDSQSARGVSPDSAASARPLPPELLPDLFGALRFLRGEQVSAGAVIAFGQEDAGTSALLAADPIVAARYLGPDGPRFAAHAQLGGKCTWAVAASAPVPTGWRSAALEWAASAVVLERSSFLPRMQTQLEAASAVCASALVPPLPSRRAPGRTGGARNPGR